MRVNSVGKVMIWAILVSFLPAAASADWRGHAGSAHMDQPRHGPWSHDGIVSESHFKRSYTPPRNFQSNFWKGRFAPYAFSNYGQGIGSHAIWKGYESGRLSPREVQELRKKSHEIRREEVAYRSDGHLSDWERRDLKGDIHNFYHDLGHELNDGERRW